MKENMIEFERIRRIAFDGAILLSFILLLAAIPF